MESGAPLDCGQIVRFVAMAFELELPPANTAPVPEIAVTVDDACREIVCRLDEAAVNQERIEVTCRPYLSDDLEGPRMDPPVMLILTEVAAQPLPRPRAIDGSERVARLVAQRRVRPGALAPPRHAGVVGTTAQCGTAGDDVGWAVAAVGRSMLSQCSPVATKQEYPPGTVSSTDHVPFSRLTRISIAAPPWARPTATVCSP